MNLGKVTYLFEKNNKRMKNVAFSHLSHSGLPLIAYFSPEQVETNSGVNLFYFYSKQINRHFFRVCRLILSCALTMKILIMEENGQSRH